MTSEFAQRYPSTVAVFQRAIHRAQLVAAESREAVVNILPAHPKIPPNAAAAISLGTFPTTLDATRLQQVADALVTHHYVARQVNVQEMIIPLPASASPTS